MKSELKDEIDKFDQLSNEWWTYKGAFKALHHINYVRIKYITKIIENEYSSITNSSISILDVGCGGGLASMALARQGMNVTGLDASQNAITVAKNFAVKKNIKLELFNESIAQHQKRKKKYNVILCLEMLEHTSSPDLIISMLSSLLKKNGIMILSTINRTLKAKIFAIYFAENILGLLPKDTHQYKYFIQPNEMASMLHTNCLSVKDMKGITFNILSRNWMLSNDLLINYIMYATKEA